MNSLLTLQALNQVVNHDICPQMKRQIRQNKLLIELLSKEIQKNKNLEKYNKNLEKQNEELDLWREHFQDEGNFLCSNCEYIFNDSQEDEYEFPVGSGKKYCEICFPQVYDNAANNENV